MPMATSTTLCRRVRHEREEPAAPAQSTATPSADGRRVAPRSRASVGWSTTLATPARRRQSGLTGEVGGDDRAEERRVGRDPPQLPRHDRHLHPGRQRAVALARPAEVEPPRRLRRLGQPGAPRRRRRGRPPSAARGRRGARRSPTATRAARASTGCPPLPLPVHGPGAQDVLLDLAGRVHRKIVDDLDRSGHLVVGHRRRAPTR